MRRGGLASFGGIGLFFEGGFQGLVEGSPLGRCPSYKISPFGQSTNNACIISATVAQLSCTQGNSESRLEREESDKVTLHSKGMEGQYDSDYPMD